MLQIRQGVFETNSSSTHSITLCSQDDYEKWKNGEVYFNDGWWGSRCFVDAKDKKFITKDDARKLIKFHGDYYRDYFDNDHDEDHYEDYVFYDNDIYSWDYYWNKRCEYLEGFVDNFTTENGDTVIAFGCYGYDG